MRGAVSRICDGAEELQGGSYAVSVGSGPLPNDMGMLLIVRMVTRVAEPEQETLQNEDELKEKDDQILDFYSRQDKLRQTLCDYIMADFPSRYVIFSFRSTPFGDGLNINQGCGSPPPG
jgi:symplekin